MDGVWVYPDEEPETEARPPESMARISEASQYLVVFLEPERRLGLSAASGLGSEFTVDGRTYHAMDEVVVYDWMYSPDGQLVGVRNLLPPEALLKAFAGEHWRWVSHEHDELRLWFGDQRGVDHSQVVHRCVFADPFRSPDGRMALAYDTYGLKPEEIARLKEISARWVTLG